MAQKQQDNPVITKSGKVAQSEKVVPNSSEDGTSAATVINGDGITVDFKGAILRGSTQETEPDQRRGTGVLVKGKNITIKNLKVHGYKIGLFARGVKGLKLIDCDFSYNWKQHLLSTPEREDESDWMSYHQNEKDEWMRYGAGAYLRDCDNFEVRGCKAVGGQNGLMLTECDKGLVWNSNFSFLSSLGIGMYRCNENRVMHNNIDWCVRGYSHGVYNRGQDSAGILVYEQSNRNVFAYNSVTHGGDGFFLWAGQTTMDTGKGGCNDNLLYGNDFSHAVTNGIEATFSRNNFVNNLMMECWHGIWGGYSYESKVIGNWFQGNAEGIAWEHGQDNLVANNRFIADRMAVNIWQNDKEDPNWGYAKQRDTKSRDNRFTENVFQGIYSATFNISRSASLRIEKNQFDGCSSPYTFDFKKINPGLIIQDNGFIVSETPNLPKGAANKVQITANATPSKPKILANGNIDLSEENLLPQFVNYSGPSWLPDVERNVLKVLKPLNISIPQRLNLGTDPYLSVSVLRGRKFIIIDEWGPYDFKSPRLVERGKTTDGRIKFDILGPSGNWAVKEIKGVTRLSVNSGKVPGELIAEIESGGSSEIKIDLVYRGLSTVDYHGVETSAGKPVDFGYTKFNVPIRWIVKWFTYYRATQDPRTTDAWKTIISGSPAREESTNELNFSWGGSPGDGVPKDEFLTVAEGAFEIANGDYILEVTSDDGVRVFLDEKMIFEDWTWHAPKTDSIKVHLNGNHKIRIEHFELDGYATLKTRIKKGQG